MARPFVPPPTPAKSPQEQARDIMIAALDRAPGFRIVPRSEHGGGFEYTFEGRRYFTVGQMEHEPPDGDGDDFWYSYRRDVDERPIPAEAVCGV